jgi:hypothetical protein
MKKHSSRYAKSLPLPKDCENTLYLDELQLQEAGFFLGAV